MLPASAVDAFTKQVLVVLADYQTMDPEWARSEATRVDIAHRVLANLRAVAQKATKTRTTSQRQTARRTASPKRARASGR